MTTAHTACTCASLRPGTLAASAATSMTGPALRAPPPCPPSSPAPPSAAPCPAIASSAGCLLLRICASRALSSAPISSSDHSPPTESHTGARARCRCEQAGGAERICVREVSREQLGSCSSRLGLVRRLAGTSGHTHLAIRLLCRRLLVCGVTVPRGKTWRAGIRSRRRQSSRREAVHGAPHPLDGARGCEALPAWYRHAL